MDTSTSGRRRRIRFPRRWWTRALLTAGVLAVLVAPAAWASHQFGDVPNSNPHHNAISAIAGAGITAGCAPGLYCPANNVRRDEMASFLQRGLGRVGASGTTAGLPLTTTFQTLASDSITAGGATGGSGFIVINGNFTAINDGDQLTETMRIEFQIREVNTGFLSNVSSMTIGPTGFAFPSATGHKMWIFSIPTGTTRTYALDARLAFAPTPAGADINAESRLIMVQYVPFGSAGTSALSSSGPGVAESPQPAGGPDNG